MIQSLAISAIRRDGGTQVRVGLDEATVLDYAEHLDDLPAVVVYFDGSAYWLSDGFHRVEAALRAGLEKVAVKINEGSRRDAFLAACGANSKHGLPRSVADKRRAVELLLADAECAKWSDRKLAETARVDHKTIAAARSRSGEFPTRPVVTPRKDSKQGKPTPALPPSAGNLAGEGEEGAGAPLATASADMAKAAAPAPDEPPIDMLGMTASADWLEVVAIVVRACGRFDADLRQLQAAARALPQPHQQRLHKALHDAAAVARAITPSVACPLCKDPDGTKGKRAGCLQCAELGWLSVEAKGGLHPAMLAPAEKKRTSEKKLTIEIVEPEDPTW